MGTSANFRETMIFTLEENFTIKKSCHPNQLIFSMTWFPADFFGCKRQSYQTKTEKEQILYTVLCNLDYWAHDLWLSLYKS